MKQVNKKLFICADYAGIKMSVILLTPPKTGTAMAVPCFLSHPQGAKYQCRQ